MVPHSITEAARALRSGEVTCIQLVHQALDTSEALDGTLGMFLAVFRDQALEAASAVDDRLAAGDDPGPLAGIPLGVKDMVCTKEGRTTAQSLVLAPEWSRAQSDAPVVENLRAAGAIITGKLTLSEFATGMPDHGKPFPVPRNPWNTLHWTGGSSSGCANSVSVGAVLGAVGSDTAGSVRTPAANCGITGFIPTHGRVSLAGCVPLGYSMDRLGPMARSAEDCARLLNSMVGHEFSRTSSVDLHSENFLDALTGDLNGLTIAVDDLERTAQTPSDPALSSSFEQAVETLRRCGARVIGAELPHFEEISLVTIMMLLSEGLAYHLPDLQQRWKDYGRSTRLKLATGTFYSAADYVQAQRVRRTAQKALGGLFAQADLVVTPTTGYPAPKLAELEELNRGRLNASMDARMYTGYWNFMGNPALSVPMGFSAEALPLGLHIAGRPMEDGTVLRAADAYQLASSWHTRRPDLQTLVG